MRKTGRRRRGVYIPPLLLFLVVLAFCLLLAGGLFRENLSGITHGGGKHNSSNVACTRTELGKDAVYSGELILVNNWTLYHFPEEQALTCIFDGKTGSYYVRDREVYLVPAALEALNAMMDAFQAQGGSKTINVVAGYRTEAFQQHLFDQSVQQNGQAHAEKFVAQPGGSEHHTGLVVDLSLFFEDGSSAEYRGTGEYAWINQNCQNYGWVVRYDEDKEALTGIGDEPWHFRYVGEEAATYIMENGLCFEEFVELYR